MTQDNAPPVILVHGLWNTVYIFSTLRRYLENQGRTVHVVELWPNNGDIGIDQQAQQLQGFIADTLGNEEGFDLVGFSMGGLVSRYYLQQLGGLWRVRRLVGVAVPHYGSRLCWFRWNMGGRQMRPGSQFLKDLNRGMAKLEPCCPVWLWTPNDWLVIPARNCCLPVGENRRLAVGSHNGMLQDECSLAAIAQALMAQPNTQKSAGGRLRRLT